MRLIQNQPKAGYPIRARRYAVALVGKIVMAVHHLRFETLLAGCTVALHGHLDVLEDDCRVMVGGTLPGMNRSVWISRQDAIAIGRSLIAVGEAMEPDTG